MHVAVDDRAGQTAERADRGVEKLRERVADDRGGPAPARRLHRTRRGLDGVDHVTPVDHDCHVRTVGLDETDGVEKLVGAQNITRRREQLAAVQVAIDDGDEDERVELGDERNRA